MVVVVVVVGVCWGGGGGRGRDQAWEGHLNLAKSFSVQILILIAKLLQVSH